MRVGRGIQIRLKGFEGGHGNYGYQAIGAELVGAKLVYGRPSVRIGIRESINVGGWFLESLHREITKDCDLADDVRHITTEQTEISQKAAKGSEQGNVGITAEGGQAGDGSMVRFDDHASVRVVRVGVDRDRGTKLKGIGAELAKP